MASCSLAISAGFSLPGETRLRSSASCEDLVGRVGPHAVEGGGQELPQRAGVARLQQLERALPREHLLAVEPPP